MSESLVLPSPESRTGASAALLAARFSGDADTVAMNAMPVLVCRNQQTTPDSLIRGCSSARDSSDCSRPQRMRETAWSAAGSPHHDNVWDSPPTAPAFGSVAGVCPVHAALPITLCTSDSNCKRATHS